MRAKFGRGPTVVSKKGSLKFISRYNRQSLYSMHRVYVQCILHDNNLIQYNNACIIGINVGPEKMYPLSKGHKPYKGRGGLIRGGPLY